MLRTSKETFLDVISAVIADSCDSCNICCDSCDSFNILGVKRWGPNQPSPLPVPEDQKKPGLNRVKTRPKSKLSK